MTRPANVLPWLPGLRQHEPTPTHVLSLGLGVDSVGLLLRWLFEPHTRSFDLQRDLVVVVSCVGHEWPDTIADVEEVLFPLLATAGVRVIQLARARRRAGADGSGVVVLDDSRSPGRLYAEGVFTLGREMLSAAAVPMVSNRQCSITSKGEVLDPVIAMITRGRPYRHVMGYEANETRRAVRDTSYNTELRTGEYPLIEWDWNRAKVISYIWERTGRWWSKSACVFCPFALVTERGRAETLPRYARFPAAGAQMLIMERTALALNPRMGLVGGKRAIDYVRAAGLDEVIAAFEHALAEEPHALYEVRRVRRDFKKKSTLPTAKPARDFDIIRSVRVVDVGALADVRAWLEGEPLQVITGYQPGDDREPLLTGTRREVGEDGIVRAVVPGRDGTGPDNVEHYFVIAPAYVEDKQREQFESLWERATGTEELVLFTAAA